MPQIFRWEYFAAFMPSLIVHGLCNHNCCDIDGRHPNQRVASRSAFEKMWSKKTVGDLLRRLAKAFDKGALFLNYLTPADDLTSIWPESKLCLKFGI